MAEDKTSEQDEAVAVTGRPQDEPLPNTTLAERYAARRKSSAKAVQAESTENKSVSPRKAARKSK